MVVMRNGLVVVVVLAGSFACSRELGERHASQEQRIDEVVDGGDGGDGDALLANDGAPACAHPICASGDKLANDCDPCTTTLCAADPYCCTTAWDATCVSEVTSICGLSCTAHPPTDAGTTTCAHAICAVGPALAATCEPCATQLCGQDPYCCAVEWDATCVSEVGSICGQACTN